MREININRQLLGLEDLLFGVGIVTQIRAGQSVNLTRINAGNLPFNETQSLLEWAQSVNLEGLGSITAELQAIYDNLTVIGNVEDNLPVVNNLYTNIGILQSLYTNISKLQNIDANMPKLQNIYTNITKLQNIDSNITKLQAIYLDLTKLESLYNNLAMLTTIYNNSTALNNINSQVIPNLTELLLVNDKAAQVAADKLTVAADKGIVAGYKNDVSVMKLAVETIYDTFDDRFLGSKANDPTVDNDGNALLDGAMYFNTSSNAMKVYDLGNTLWVTIPQIYLSGLLDVQLTSITTGDLLTWNGTKWVNTRTPKVDSIQLNGGTSTEGILSWNTNEGTADLRLQNGVTLQLGQENNRLVRNNTGSTILNGTVLMATGSLGASGRITVGPATGLFDVAKNIYGIATQDILNGADGYCTIEGKVRGINTSGSTVGETWTNGQILYVKPNDNGRLTKVEPAYGELKVSIAKVIHAHATNGLLEIRITSVLNENAYEPRNINIQTHIARTDNPHGVTKSQLGLGNVTNFDTTNATNITSGTLSSARLPLTGISAGTYKSVTVDTTGRITAATNPTTIAGFGITDAYTKIQMDTSLYGVVAKVTSTDNAVVRFNGTTGEVQDSGVIIDDAGNITASNTSSAQGGSEAFSIKYIGGQKVNVISSARSNSAWSFGFGVKPSNTTIGEFISTVDNINWSRGALLVDETLKFYTATAQNTAVGSTVSMTEVFRTTTAGDLLLTSGTGVIGYGIGAGGTVTQLTSKSTAVTLNKPTGRIIMHDEALAAGASVLFLLSNSIIDSGDACKVSLVGGMTSSNNYRVEDIRVVSDSATIRVTNVGGVSRSEALVLSYSIIKGATA